MHTVILRTVCKQVSQNSRVKKSTKLLNSENTKKYLLNTKNAEKEEQSNKKR